MSPTNPSDVLEPGVYEDCQGDLWVVHDDDTIQHAARRGPFTGRLYPCLGRDTGPMEITRFVLAFADNPDSEAEVFPLTRVRADDELPPDLPC